MTTQTQVTLDAQPREALGSKNKALRRAGFTPIHVYGHGEDSLALQSAAHDLAMAVRHVGRTAPVIVRVEGGAEHFVMVREIQRHPVDEHLLHVDFIRISRTERLRVRVPVHVEGEAPATRAEGLSLSHDLHEVEVAALPFSIPSVFIVDVSAMEEPDSVISVSDLEIPTGVEMVSDLALVIVHIAAQRSGSDGTPAGAAALADADANSATK